MNYIKAKYRLSGGPAAEDWTIYGWDTEWTKKTQTIGTTHVQVGEIVAFQPISVKRDGKFIFVATKRNVDKAKAMLAKRQISLAPGEKLEVDEGREVELVEVWPEAPQKQTIDMEAMEAAGTMAERPDAYPAPTSAKRSRKSADLNPDIEG